MTLRDALLSWLHFVAIFAVLTLPVMQLVLCRPGLDSSTITRMARLNIVYLFVGIVVAGSGLARALWGMRGWDYYATQPLFYGKIALLVMMASFSIKPALAFHRWRANLAHDANARPDATEVLHLRFYLHAALTMLLLLALDAVFLARGFAF